MSSRFLPRLLPLFAAVALAALTGEATPAHGASFTVNATHDAVDAAPCDGACADATGACTLRSAVMETNALAGADEISLPAGTYSLSIPGEGEDASATGDLDIAGNLAVKGDGATNTVIDGAQLDGVLEILSETTTSLSGATVRNGWGGGGITNQGSLELSATIITDNVGFQAGGVYNRGTLTVTSTNVSHNRAFPSFGVSFLKGGGIANDVEGSATLVDSTVADNEADDGGGINNSGELTLRRVTVSGNVATGSAPHGIPGGGRGGGIFTGSLTMENVTVSGNSALALGSQFSGFGGLGGGLFGGGDWSLINVTIAENVATSLEDASLPERMGTGGGIWYTRILGEAALHNVVVARNQADVGGDCFGPVTSLGHNLDSDGTCGLTGPGDLSNVDPVIASLADNGGPTQTHALVQGGCPSDACIVPSPAIDAGDSAACPGTDQRGETRPFDGDGDGIGECDIGAYEAQEPALSCTGSCGPMPTSPTPTPSGPTAVPTSSPRPPISLPPTGDNGDSPRSIPSALPLLATCALAVSIWLARRALTHR